MMIQQIHISLGTCLMMRFFMSYMNVGMKGLSQKSIHERHIHLKEI